MKYLLILIFSFAVAGCTTVPVTKKFPDIPDELKSNCQELSLADKEITQISKLLIVINENYSKYHECKIKNELWLKWYNDQKIIYENIK